MNHLDETAASTRSNAPRVCAVVVTFNRCELLRECLSALQEQTRQVDEILVVDNASTDGTLQMLRGEFPQVRVLALEENGGGAGGFHAGMKAAYEAGFEWLWLMDDDGRPAPDCLEKLLEHAAPMRVLAPLQRDASGRLYGIGVWRNIYVDVTHSVARGAASTGDYLFAFVGPLLSREAIAAAGLPNREFFIWFDDYEYALRLHRCGVKIVAVPDAIFHHDLGGVTRAVTLLGKRALRNQQPAWKTYYGTRNHLYTVTRTRRSGREVWWYFVQQTWLLLGDLAFEPDRKTRAAMRWRGIRDGALGRLGKRL